MKNWPEKYGHVILMFFCTFLTNFLIDAETCGSSKPQPMIDLHPTVGPEGKPENKSDTKTGTETEFREVMVDSSDLELVDECCSDPVDA